MPRCCKCARGKQGLPGDKGSQGLPGVPGTPDSRQLVIFGSYSISNDPQQLLALNGNAQAQSSFIGLTPTAQYVYTALERTTKADVTVYVENQTNSSPPIQVNIEVFVGPLPFPIVPSSSLNFTITLYLSSQSFAFDVHPNDVIWVVVTYIVPSHTQPSAFAFNVQLSLHN